ncbi:hypothetical protein [Azospirillum oleiclasticum]|uniref:hypothetical protein n=1 Tax=Azospirillum oleiclasticum TaxID=2735135 RepID=UPI0015D4D7A3|nr:hypothetical protein [Azospirillum oleiclasticum]
MYRVIADRLHPYPMSPPESIEAKPDTPQPDSADQRTQLRCPPHRFRCRTGLAGLASGVGSKKLLEGVVPVWVIWAVDGFLKRDRSRCRR